MGSEGHVFALWLVDIDPLYTVVHVCFVVRVHWLLLYIIMIDSIAQDNGLGLGY